MDALKRAEYKAWIKELKDSGIPEEMNGFLAAISQGELPLLFLLEDNPEGLPEAEIARQLNLSRARVSVLAAKLVLKGYIKASGNSEKKKPLVLTEKGKRNLSAKYKELEMAENRFCEPLSEEELETFQGLIRKIIDTNKKENANAETR